MPRLWCRHGGWTSAMAVLLCTSLSAGEPDFKLLRTEENYAYLKDPTARTSWWEQTKYVPLGDGVHVSFGGEWRFQYEFFDNINWGAGVQDGDGHALQRVMLHGDLRFSSRLRLFVQLKSGLEEGLAGGPRPPDEDQLDLHQGFIVFPLGSAMEVEAGRIELNYGSRRLISVREGPNVRRTFEAVRLVTRRREWRIDAFHSRPVTTELGIFADDPIPGHALWGIYATGYLSSTKGLDVYFLGHDRGEATFDSGTAEERRRSLGGRYWAERGPWRYDMEGLFQWGDFGDRDIRAWTFTGDFRYTTQLFGRIVHLGLKSSVISGDDDPDDDRLETFSPLYPRGGYFGLAALIGPANLVDIHPSLSIWLNPHWSLSADWDVFWRHSRTDGVYGPTGALERPTNGATAREIGNQFAMQLAYAPNSFWEFVLEGAYFAAGPFLEQSGAGEDITYLSMTFAYKF